MPFLMGYSFGIVGTVLTFHYIKIAMKGHAGVLESEIKLDRGRGGNVEKKEEELKSIEDKYLSYETDDFGYQVTFSVGDEVFGFAASS